jgi:hypothetical protein
MQISENVSALAYAYTVYLAIVRGNEYPGEILL